MSTEGVNQDRGLLLAGLAACAALLAFAIISLGGMLKVMAAVAAILMAIGILRGLLKR